MASEHSPLGASSASRWLACPKSYGLIQATGSVGEESPEAALGTAAHALAEECLALNKDAWEYTGLSIYTDVANSDKSLTVGYGENEIDPDAVQVYLNYVRSLAEIADKSAVELRLGDKWQPHPLYKGTADTVAVGSNWLEIVDYKNGAGIIVEPGSPQLKYYGVGAYKELASHLPDDAEVRLTIVQPRAACQDIRTHHMTVGELRAWSRDVLVPGMLKAEAGEGDFVTGEHCRFCPAILHCPKQHEDMKALNQIDDSKVTDEDLDLLYPTFATVKMFMKAAEKRLMARLMAGGTLNNAKLVQKRAAGRVWKEEAPALLETELGDDAFDKKLKSPAQVEKLSKKWKDFVAERAFLPVSDGYNLVPATDPAPAANPKADLQATFGHFETTQNGN